MIQAAHLNPTSTFVWGLLHAKKCSLFSTLRNGPNSRDLLEAVHREIGRLYTNLIMFRRTTSPQTILGKSLPSGIFLACSPVVTARDSRIFPNPDKFYPQRWLTPSGQFDETQWKKSERYGNYNQFGKGEHACPGEKVARAFLLDICWKMFLGDSRHPGYDIEIVSGTTNGTGIDNVGVEGAWATDNLGTPFEKGGPVMIKFTRRTLSDTPTQES
jgi:cytochrome P450